MKKKILIIDDDRHTARFLAKRLRARNYEVMVADDGVQGVQKAKERIPDLILLDMIMPQLSGIEVFEKLRHYGLFEDLFPLTEEILSKEKDGFPRILVIEALNSTDRLLQGC